MCATSEFVYDFVVVDELASRDWIDIDIGNVCFFWRLAMSEMEKRTSICAGSVW